LSLDYSDRRIIYKIRFSENGEQTFQIWGADIDELSGQAISGFFPDNPFFQTTKSPLLYYGSYGEKEIYSKYGDEESTLLVSQEIGNYFGLFLPQKIIGNNLYFIQDDGLWSTDGTLSGTGQLFEDAELPYKYNEYLYYANNDTPVEGNYLRRFTEDNPIGSDEQVGESDMMIYKPIRFSSGIDGKLLFLSSAPYDDEKYQLYALNLPPNSVFDKDSPQTQLTVFPNPTRDELTIPLPNDFQNDEVKLSIQNISGQVFLNQTMRGAESVTLSLPANLINGMYFLKISTKDKHAFGKVMVLK